MMTRATSLLLFLASPLMALCAASCKDPETKDTNVICTELEAEDCPMTGTAGYETTEFESGDSETGTGGPAEMQSDECHHNSYGAGNVGVQYQCTGELHTSVNFFVGGDSCVDLLGVGWCDQSSYFSENLQPYAAAEVIACCGEFDYQYADMYKRYCAYDMYQQLCITIPERLQAGINDGTFGAFADKVAPIQVWIAQHYDACFNSLKDNNSAELPSVVSHWTLGDFGSVHGVVLNIRSPTKIDGLSLPKDQSEWLSCIDVRGNNDQVFEDTHPPQGGVSVGVNLAAPLDAALVGPSVFGGVVTASATFAAACSPRGCPAAVFSYDVSGAGFTMEEFDVFNAGSVILTNGVVSLVADRVQIRLWGQALGYKVIDPATSEVLGYEIPAGAAQFMVAGVNAAEGANRFMAVNSTDLWLTQGHGDWGIDSFNVEFEDGGGNLWTVALGDSRWHE